MEDRVYSGPFRILFTPGDVIYPAYIIEAGFVEMRGSKGRVLTVLGEGDIVGAEALLGDKDVASVEYVTAGGAILRAISPGDDRYERASAQTIRHLVMGLRLHRMVAVERIFHVLRILIGSTPGIHINATHLGRLTGMSRAWAGQAISQLADRGLCKKGKRLFFVDKAAVGSKLQPTDHAALATDLVTA